MDIGNKKALRRCLIVGKIFAFMLISLPAQIEALGFHVQPAKISFEISPGKTAVTRIQIRNHALDSNADMVVELLHLTQGDNGIIGFIDQDPDDEVEKRHRSCLDWIRIDNQVFSIEKGAEHFLDVRFVVPETAFGDYVGAIGIRSLPRGREGGVALAVRFAVLVEISVTGRAARRHVELHDVGLRHFDSGDKEHSRDLVAVGVSNTGELMAIIDGALTIFQIQGEQARRVMTLPVEGVKILPGSSIEIVKETPRRLPSGNYRVVADLLMDQRRIGSTTSSIYYQGDPSVNNLVADAMISYEPSTVTILGAPLSKRRQFVNIMNDGDEPVSVTLGVGPVDFLESVSMRGVYGLDLLSDGWISVAQDSFLLSPGRNRRIALSAVFPDESRLRPSSYAKLLMNASYLDGKTAAESEILIVAHNNRVVPIKDIEVLRAGLATGEDDVCTISIEYCNVGETDVNVEWSARITDASRSRNFQAIEFLESSGVILPMEIQRSVGFLEVDRLDLGRYILELQARIDGERMEWNYYLDINEHEDRKYPELTPLPSGQAP